MSQSKEELPESQEVSSESPEGEEPKEDLEWGGLDLTLEDDPAEGGLDDEDPDD